MAEIDKHPCYHGITEDCARHDPEWVKKVLAFRLLIIIAPRVMSRRLHRLLHRFVLPPGLEIPPGVTLPPGSVPTPGAEIPDTWNPGDPVPPGMVIPPGTVFPPGWRVGDPVPPGVVMPPGGLPDDWTPPDPIPPGVIPPPTPPSDSPGAIPPPGYHYPMGPGPAHRPADTKPAPGGTWVAHFDNTNWRLSFLIDCPTWESAMWRCKNNNATQLDENGVWNGGYRPTHIKVTYTTTGPTLDKLDVRDCLNAQIAYQDNYTSAVALAITWGASNICTLIMGTNNQGIDITNIQFYEPAT